MQASSSNTTLSAMISAEAPVGTSQNVKNTLKLIGPSPRRDELGLKSIDDEQQTIIALHLSGDYSIPEIARMRSADGVPTTQSDIHNLLADPLVEGIVARCRAGQIQDLESILPKAIEAVRTAVSHSDVNTKLKGVDRFVKLRENVKASQAADENLGNVLLDARTEFTSLIRKLADKYAEAEEVKSNLVDLTDDGSGTFTST